MFGRREVAPRGSSTLPALVNFFLPPLGQLIQGRLFATLFWVVVWVGAIAFGAATLGVGLIVIPVVYLLCIIDAAKYRG